MCLVPAPVPVAPVWHPKDQQQRWVPCLAASVQYRDTRECQCYSSIKIPVPPVKDKLVSCTFEIHPLPPLLTDWQCPEACLPGWGPATGECHKHSTHSWGEDVLKMQLLNHISVKTVRNEESESGQKLRACSWISVPRPVIQCYSSLCASSLSHLSFVFVIKINKKMS